MHESPHRNPISRRRKIIEAGVLIAGATIVVGTLSSIALLLYTEDSREAAVQTIVIDEGANDLIALGQNPLDIPSTWGFLADDTLVLDNRDEVTHMLGPWSVLPNTIGRFELQPADAGFLATSLHPSGAVTIDVEPRDYDFTLIAVPTFGFGLAVGLILWIGLRVSRAMGGTHDDLYRRDPIGLDEAPGDDEQSSLGI
jgi:hypothetical protein